MDAYLGDFVKVKGSRGPGLVKAKYINFRDTKTEEWWVGAQEDKITDEDKAGSWYDVLCNDGGCIMVPERRIEEIVPEQVLNNNAWVSFYFRKK